MMRKLLILVGLSALGGMLLFAAGRGKVRAGAEQPRPRASHEDMAKRQRPQDPNVADRTVRLDDLRKTTAEEADAPGDAKEERTSSLIARSTIISSGSNWTIVPNGAVLHVPERFKSRVNGQRQGTLIGCREFFAKNRTWVKLQDVTLEQARGEAPVNPNVLEALKSAGLLTVAVCAGGPISVQAPKEETVDPEKAAANEEQLAAQREKEQKTLEDLKARLLKGLR